jgi:anti-sigma B factor antagonist
MHRVHVELASSHAVVGAEGELDAFVAPELEQAFEAVADAQRVVVDLGSISFLDSTALGLVVRALREIDERGGDARIVLPRGAARRIFELTMLDTILPIAPTRDVAIAELA